MDNHSARPEAPGVVHINFTQSQFRDLKHNIEMSGDNRDFLEIAGDNPTQAYIHVIGQLLQDHKPVPVVPAEGEYDVMFTLTRNRDRLKRNRTGELISILHVDPTIANL